MENGSFYTGKSFHVSQSDGTVYHGIECEGCVFSHCVFLNCIFKECRFIDCSFSECTLSAITLNQTIFHEVVFIKSKIIGMDWTKARSIRGLSFQSSVLDYSNFSYIKHPKLLLKDSAVHEVDFTEADLSDSSFNGSDLHRSVFHHTNLSGSSFAGAYNYAIDPTANKVAKARFSLPEAASLLTSLGIELSP